MEKYEIKILEGLSKFLDNGLDKIKSNKVQEVRCERILALNKIIKESEEKNEN